MEIKMSQFYLGTMILKFDLPATLIDDINKAFDLMHAGESIRSVVEF